MTCTESLTGCENSSLVLDPIYVGDSKIFNLKFENEDGTPYDITGSTLTLTVKRSRDDVTPLFQLVQLPAQILDPVNGETQMEIPASETENWEAPMVVYYDILWDLPSGSSYTFMAGSFTPKGYLSCEASCPIS